MMENRKKGGILLKANPIEDPTSFYIPEEVELERITLRKPSIDNIKEINEAVAETFDQLTLWMPWAKEPVSIEATEEFVRNAIDEFASRKSLSYLVFNKKDSKFIGSTGFPRIDWSIPSFELGYWIRKTAQGQGYVSEAVNGLTNLAMKELGVPRVFLKIDPLNKASRNVAKRCNYTHEGTLRNNATNNNGELSDDEFWSVISK